MKIDPGRLRQLRETRAWSQEQLAEVAGLSVRTVQRAESGGAASPETRMALAAALGMEPADLHGGTDPQAGAGGGANGQKKLGEEERAFRSMVVALGLVVVFVLLLLFGYMVGRDMAAKDNRQACIAEGRTDCR